MAVLSHKLIGESVLELPNTTGLPMQDLEQMSLPAILWAISVLGKYYTLCHGKTPAQGPSADVEYAAAALADFPTGYHDFLNQLGQVLQGDSPQALGLRKQFPGYYEAMFKNTDHADDMVFMKREFVNFGLLVWGNAVVDKKLFHSIGQAEAYEQRYLSISQAAKEIGVRPITVRHWAEKGLISTRKLEIAGQVRYIIDIESSDIANQVSGRTMNGREAAARVGLPVSVLRSLRESGHYRIEHMPRHKQGYHEADCDNFREELLRGSLKQGNLELEKEDLFSLSYVMQQIQFWSPSGKAGFIGAYLDGCVQSVGRTSDDIYSIYFRKSDVVCYAMQSRIDSSDGNPTRTEAASCLGCDPQAIEGLVSTGYLIGIDGPNRLLIEKSSLERFSSEYVALAVLARRYETTVIRLLRLCTDAGIEVLKMPRKQAGPIPFVRQDQESILLEYINRYPSREQKRKALQERSGNEEKLRAYLKSLVEEGKQLPRRGAKPNLAKIAGACGFHRNTFYTDDNVSRVLVEFENLPSNEERLRAYIKRLMGEGEQLPSWGGKPNLAKIAAACGFSRNIFYSDENVSRLLADFEGG